jgi:putative colanic acid biosynthesis UDP-glucose lipid carrier transferase
MAVGALSEKSATPARDARMAAHRAPGSFSLNWTAALVGTDLVMFLVAAGFAIRVALMLGARLNEGAPLSAVISIVGSMLVFRWLGLYRGTMAYSAKDELYYTIVALAVGFAPQLLLFAAGGSLSTSRLVICLAWAFSLVLVSAGRAVVHELHLRRERRSSPILIAGSPSHIASAEEEISSLGKRTVRFDLADVDADRTTTDACGHTTTSWLQRAQELSIQSVVLTEVISPETLPWVMAAARRARIDLAFAPPGILERSSYSLRISSIGGQALIVPRSPRAIQPASQVAKRCFDLVFSLAGLILFAPLMLVAALAVFIDSGRPIIYKQVRVGRDGREFDIYKFRSMPSDAEAKTGPVWTVAGDNRCTRVGAFLRRTSIDELPQIFNVLRGEMSIVGPRPERPCFVQDFAGTYPLYRERLLVRPGITGWSHVHMPRNHDQSQIAERLRLDLEYIRHWSLYMDLSVVFKTAAELLFQKAR